MKLGLISAGDTPRSTHCTGVSSSPRPRITRSPVVPELALVRAGTLMCSVLILGDAAGDWLAPPASLRFWFGCRSCCDTTEHQYYCVTATKLECHSRDIHTTPPHSRVDTMHADGCGLNGRAHLRGSPAHRCFRSSGHERRQVQCAQQTLHFSDEGNE